MIICQAHGGCDCKVKDKLKITSFVSWLDSFSQGLLGQAPLFVAIQKDTALEAQDPKQACPSRSVATLIQNSK